MHLIRIRVSSVILIILFLPFSPLIAQEPAEIVISNARIIDGTGNPWYKADILISQGKIREIVPQGKGLGQKVIDAKGLIVAPGFIDVHTHLDGSEFSNPEAKNYIYDGVTTVITGNCGSSRVNIRNYLQQLDSLKLSINVGTLMGHSTLRRNVIGLANRAASEEEMVKMEKLMEKAMKDGAYGLSTGLIYIPGTYATTDEVIRLAQIANRYNGIYTSHMRSEADSVTEAINEALHIGEVTGCRVEISHFKVAGQNNWGRSNQTLQQIIDARKRGIDVVIDQYPYTASSTHLSTLFPKDFLSDGPDSILFRLRQPEKRAYAKNFLLDNLKKLKLKNFSYIVVAEYKADSNLNGKSIEEINLLKGKKKNAEQEAETILEIMENGGASVIFHVMSESDVQNIIKFPHNICISDAGVRVNDGKSMLHPRGYGANARVLGHYVRDLQLISLEEAIRRMTSLPAQHFQIEKKGLILPGYDADLVIFDPEKVKDKATYENPYQFSEGFQFVLVNGKVVINNGIHTGLRSGKVIRKSPR
jgi:N-acyl-D-amino-acid deacylase